MISIRAPLAVSDEKPRLDLCRAVISIRAPLAGSDLHGLPLRVPGRISIRAPLAGSDNRGPLPEGFDSNFNPRSPCGERRCVQQGAPRIPYFNPRSPCGERQDLHTRMPRQ